MTIMPYLSFSGNCEQAFLWYAEVFGGAIQHLAKYGDLPENPDAPLSDAQKQQVMHGCVLLGEGSLLSGADALGPVESGGAVSLQAHWDEPETARRVFAALSEGGTVLQELAQNPPPDDSGVSGCVKDKYGFMWILSAQNPVKNSPG